MLNVSCQGSEEVQMIHVRVSGRLISTCSLWKDPPPSFSVDKDTCDRYEIGAREA